jgi:hypothetical protein
MGHSPQGEDFQSHLGCLIQSLWDGPQDDARWGDGWLRPFTNGHPLFVCSGRFFALFAPFCG